jgi:hypothetical protein
MINAHIELVEKWLANPESVSKKELKANAADVADATAYADDDDADAAAYANADATYWVKRYKKLKNC